MINSKVNMKKFDIAIVGAGLVGSIAALLLARNNFKIILFDAAPEEPKRFFNSNSGNLQPSLRMSAITLKSQEILDELKIWANVQTRCGLMKKVFAWEEQGPADVTLDSLLIGRNHLASIVENDLLLDITNEQIKSFSNIVISRPDKINNIFYNRNNKIHEIQAESGDYLAQLIIGADGANSWLRQYFNFELNIENYDHYALVTNIYTEKHHGNTAYQKFLKQGPVALLPWVQENCCSIVWSQSEQQAKEMQACDADEFKYNLEQAVDGKLGKILDIEKRVIFPLVKRHVKNYYQSGVVLIGDAAHTIHPLAGQGLNLGIYDAYELAGVLTSAQTDGRAINSDSTLKKYQMARKGHNQQVLNLMDFFKQFYNDTNQSSKPLSLLRNIGMTTVNHFSFIKKQITRFAAGYY